MVGALESSGCRIIFCSDASKAPFRITFETPDGGRMGIMAYAFLANSKDTKNRPTDEHRFQLKYGSKERGLHELWQDPYGLYTTLLVGIDPERGIFVGADPVLHSPTKMFISVEFKRAHVEEILRSQWHSWERERRSDMQPVEVLVGGTKESFLRYVRFEKEALGEDQGHRGWLADRSHMGNEERVGIGLMNDDIHIKNDRVHELAREFDLREEEVMTLISGAPRLKMAVRGWVAEEHLFRLLKKIPSVEKCEAIREEGGADIRLVYKDTAYTIECKNVLRKLTSKGNPRLDFQRTRASKADPCSRYYSPADFDIVAACLHSVTDRWEYKFALTRDLAAHSKCAGKLANNVQIDETWTSDPEIVLSAALG